MSTSRQNTQQPRIVPAGSPSTSHSTPFISLISTAPPVPGIRASSFWVQSGMSTLFDWLTDPHNYDRLTKKNPLPGQKQRDLHLEIARLVNERHGTDWSRSQVKTKITYIKKRYREAAALHSTGEEGGDVLERQEEICPLFVRLQAVLGDSPSANPHHRPRKSGIRQESATSGSSDEESDLEGPANSDLDENIGDATAHHHKRRKAESMEIRISNAIDKMHRTFYQQRSKYEQDLRLREQAVAQRESEFAERMVRLRDEANEKALQMQDDTYQMMEKLRAQFRDEMTSERGYIRQERADLGQQWEELKREKAEFLKEREDLKIENAELRKELDMRLAEAVKH